MKKIHPWETDDILEEWPEKGTPKTWEEVTEFDEYGLGWVFYDGGTGYVDREGNLVISKKEYEHFTFPTFEQGYGIACKQGKVGVINYKNEVIIPFKYDGLQFNTSKGKILFSANLNGKGAIIDMQENIIFPYNDFLIREFNPNYIIVTKDEKFGLIDFQGNFIIPFKYDNLSFVGEHLCAGKTTDIFFDKNLLDELGVNFSWHRLFTKDYQKIVYGVIDIKENILFPFISDHPIHLFNHENGRAKICINFWEHLDTEHEEFCYVVEKTGEKVPLLEHHIKENWVETNFHKMCEELVFGIEEKE